MMINKITSKIFLRYLIVGVFVYSIEIIVILSSQKFLGFSSVLAIAISFWVGVASSFILNKLFTFQDKRTHHKIVTAQFLGYLSLTLFNFGFTIVFAHIFQSYISAVWCRSITLAMIVSWNYLIYKRHIFKLKEVVI